MALQVASTTPFTATISWHTRAETTGRVSFGTAAIGDTRWLPPTPTATEHVATLPGLAFATTYHVTVTSSTRAGEQATGAVDLTTPGPPTSPQTAIGSGAILLDGQPWFPLLVYGQCSTLYDSSINTGITLFVANPCGGLGTQLETLGGRALSAALSDEPVVSGAGLIGTLTRRS